MKKVFFGLSLVLALSLNVLSMSSLGINHHEPPDDDCPWEYCMK